MSIYSSNRGQAPSLLNLPTKIATEAERARTLAAMNANYAVVSEGGRTIVIGETFDPAMNRQSVERSSFTDIRARYQNRKVRNEDEGWTPLGTWWLNHPDRRQYDRVVFAPGKPAVIGSSYNLWRGFGVTPCAKGEWGDGWSLFLDHIAENICGGDGALLLYVLAWMAQGVQHPEESPEVAIVLRSEERGTGKSFFARQYRLLFGQHGLEISNAQHLTGRFNSHLEDCCVLVLNEAFWAGSHGDEAVLKTLITEDTITIEPKGFPLKTVSNYLRIIMTSNAEWVIPAGCDERRFLVLDVGTAQKQDTAYFAAIAKQMDNGGRAAMLYDLLHYRYSRIDLRRAPQTDALTKQKLLSLRPAEKWLFDKLSEGQLLPDDDGWCPDVSKSALVADFAESLRSGGRRGDLRASQTELGTLLAKMFGGQLSEHRPRVGGARVRRWILPSLAECRKLFEARLGASCRWPPDDGAPGKRSKRVRGPFPR